MPNIAWPAGEPAGAPSLTCVNMQKHVDLSKAPFSYSFENQYGGNCIHIRDADIMLMYPDAQNEAGGPDQTVLDAFDQIRVVMPNADRKL